MKQLALPALVTLCLTASPTLAKKRRKAVPAAPVDVTFVNHCKRPLAVQLGKAMATVKVEVGGRSGPHSVAPNERKDDWVHLLKVTLEGSAPVERARLGLMPAGRYEITLAECANGSMDVISKGLHFPEAKSPHANAKVRFRQAQKGQYFEVKAGKTGRFKQVSLGFTTPLELPAGEAEFTGRARMGSKRGPVMSTRRLKLALVAGHKYLVEWSTKARDTRILFEDEGLAGSK